MAGHGGIGIPDISTYVSSRLPIGRRVLLCCLNCVLSFFFFFFPFPFFFFFFPRIPHFFAHLKSAFRRALHPGVFPSHSFRRISRRGAVHFFHLGPSLRMRDGIWERLYCCPPCKYRYMCHPPRAKTGDSVGAQTARQTSLGWMIGQPLTGAICNLGR